MIVWQRYKEKQKHGQARRDMVICSWERDRVIERVVNNTLYREKDR